MRLTNRTQLTALALAFVASACSDSPTQPTVSADLSSALSEMSLVGFIPASLSPTFSTAPLGPNTGGCAFNSTSQGFVCPALSLNGVTISHGFTLFDASGQPQSAFGRTTTASIRTTTAMVGSLSLGTGSTTIDQHDTMTLSGLLTGDHVLDGTQTAHFTGTVAGSTMDQTVNTTIAGLKPPASGSANRYPSAGTITTTTSSTYGAGSSGSTMIMTFNGTSRVSVTFTTAGITQRCTLDLAATSFAAMSCT